MTFWLMSKTGEVIHQHGVPKEWSEMTPAEAGDNAAKEELYYAIRPYAVKAEDSKGSSSRFGHFIPKVGWQVTGDGWPGDAGGRARERLVTGRRFLEPAASGVLEG